jgi:hypothetical protein
MHFPKWATRQFNQATDVERRAFCADGAGCGPALGFAAATIAKGWPLVWTQMALFPLLTGFIGLYDSIKGTEDQLFSTWGDAANGRSLRLGSCSML